MGSNLHQGAVEAPAGALSTARDDEYAVLALFDATSLAWRDGDAAEFVGRYAEDATVILPGVHLRGRADIRQAMGEAFAGPLKGTKRIHTPQSIRFVGADVAVAVTRSVTQFPGESEAAPERWDLVTWTLVRRDGEWFVEAYPSCQAS
jgi:uncharacterized protein (TIGR02246 family)